MSGDLVNAVELYLSKRGKMWQRTVGYVLEKTSLQIVKTTIGITSTKVNTPNNTGDFIIYHEDAGLTLYIGESPATSADVALLEGDVAEFDDMKKGNNNEIYGIAASGSITVFAVGVYKA